MTEPNKTDDIGGLRYAAFGFEFGAIIGAAVVGGYYVDRYLGTAPWFTLLFIIGGMYGALRRLLWSLKRHSKSG
jgi:F0F1-type ATP synthase assembly protein I